MTAPKLAPHFVCIGAQKAGTQWLYDQAASHPDVWMPPIKELRYFYGRWPKARREALARLNVLLREQARGNEVDRRDLEFLRRMWFETADDSAGDLRLYRRLFWVADGAITGDVSPQYARLDRDRAAALLKGLPRVPVLYFVREPVGRVWSQICMMVHWGKIDPAVVERPEVLAEYLHRPGVAEMSFQSRVVEMWSELAADRFAVFTMGDMIAQPTDFRWRVFARIGLDAAQCELPADYNKKDGRPKPLLTVALQRVIEDFLADEPERLERLLEAQGGDSRSAGDPTH